MASNKKKLLMSVVGIGYGHATRSEAVYSKLKNKTKVKILSYGAAKKYFDSLKIKSEDFGGIEYKGNYYSFSALTQLIDFFKNPSKLKKDYFVFRDFASDFEPDVVFSDSEPNSFFYAVNRNIPVCVLNNVITTLNHYNIIPLKLRSKEIMIQHLLLKRLMKFMLARKSTFVVPSFEKKIVYHDKVKHVDLIVRKKPSDCASVKQIKNKLGVDDFYYVNIGGAEIEKYFFNILKKVLPEFRDKTFVVSSNYVSKKIHKEKNMIIYPFISNALDVIKASEGIISPAGHSIISEAVVFKKPIMTVPIRNHIEQIVNGLLLEKKGYGSTCLLDKRLGTGRVIKSLEDFFNKRDSYLSELKKSKFMGNGASQIAKTILKN